MAANEPTKLCCWCKQTLPVTSFYRNTAAKDGRQHGCGECRRKRKKAIRHADPARALAIERARPPRNKPPINAREREWRVKNRALAQARSKASRLAKIDEYRARTRQYKKDFPEKVAAHDARRRARTCGASGPGWTAEDVAAIKKAQRSLCAYCRVKLPRRFHRDHIVPLKRGGAHDRRNLQLLCEPCNLSKGARDPIDHARTLGLLL